MIGFRSRLATNQKSLTSSRLAAVELGATAARSWYANDNVVWTPQDLIRFSSISYERSLCRANTASATDKMCSS